MLRTTDEAYKRMLVEQNELKEKIDKLDTFIKKARLSHVENITLDEIHLLEEQLAPMREYYTILSIRIDRVKE